MSEFEPDEEPEQEDAYNVLAVEVSRREMVALSAMMQEPGWQVWERVMRGLQSEDVAVTLGSAGKVEFDEFLNAQGSFSSMTTLLNCPDDVHECAKEIIKSEKDA